MPEDLRQRAKEVIGRIFEGEPWDEFERDPKCFSSSLQWAGDSSNSNVVELACEIARPGLPLHGWKAFVFRVQICGEQRKPFSDASFE